MSKTNEVANWTFVSAFYNLDRHQDISKSNVRRSSYYRDRITIFDFDLPTILFCDPDRCSHYEKIAKEKGCHNYQIIGLPFEEFELYPYLDDIRANRLNSPFYTNNRNSAAYAILVMSKMDLMARAAKVNPFNSTMLAWADYSYEKDWFETFEPQFRKIKEADPSIFPKDRYVLGLIDWVSELLEYYHDIFYNRSIIKSTFIGGFHFGNINIIESIWSLIKEETIETIELGFGHAEEQIFFFTFLNHRDKFDYYPSDYGIHIFNMFYPHKGLDVSYKMLLPHLLHCKEYKMAHTIAGRILKAKDENKITMDPHNVAICHLAHRSYRP